MMEEKEQVWFITGANKGFGAADNARKSEYEAWREVSAGTDLNNV